MRTIVHEIGDGVWTARTVAWHDGARPLAGGCGSLRHEAAGWVLHTTDAMLTEASGALVVTDEDICRKDTGASVYGESPDQYLARAVAGCVCGGVLAADAPGITYHIIDADQLPRLYPDAWVLRSGRVVVDMARARAIHMGRIRRARDAALAALDVPFMRAVEAGDAAEQQRIAAEKQALRDIPQTFDLDSYRTAEALGAAWPLALIN